MMGATNEDNLQVIQYLTQENQFYAKSSDLFSITLQVANHSLLCSLLNTVQNLEG